ncbi:MAG: right-handed parallel beta-helix repeat-containing protein [Candidatus Thorarchaeota archaeon]
MVKLNRKIIITVSTIILIVLIVFSITYVVYKSRQVKPDVLIKHEPIIILKDEDFETYKFPGKGTAKKPYLIQNLNITTNHSEIIYIERTTKYFVIQNCYLRKYDLTDTRSEQTGIYIADAAKDTVKIVNNILNASCYGIEVYNSKGVTIENNIIDILPVAGWAGPYSPFAKNIFLDNCSFAKVENNTCFYGGISISSSENSTLLRNSCYGRGIGVSESESATISENYIQGKFHEIEYFYYRFDPVVSFTDSPHTTFLNNTMNNCDFSTSSSLYSEIRNNEIFNGGYKFNYGSVGLMYDPTVIVEGNFVNSKPLGYFIGEQEIIISSEQFGQLFFFNCSEVTVKNQVIHDVNTGITFHECGAIHLIHNSISSSGEGIRGNLAEKLEIISNNLNNNELSVEARGGIDSVIANNTCNFNLHAMNLFNFNNLTIENNNLLNNTIGLDVANISNSIIRNNSLTSDGSFNNPGFFGISVSDSDSIVIDQNSMLARFTDIRFLESTNLTITNNILINSSIGIEKKNLSTYTLFNNTVNDKQFGVFYYEENLSINSADYGQLYLFNCSNFNISNQIMEIHTLVADSRNVSFNNCSWINFFRKAITIVNSVNCNITNSTIVSNPTYMDGRNYVGVDISNSSFCTISYTLIKYCTNYGLRLDGYSYNNTIHHNAFIENGLYPFSSQQASDNGYNNTWYDITKLEGNYWFDYDFSGSYSIWGGAGSIDPYPLLTNPL